MWDLCFAYISLWCLWNQERGWEVFAFYSRLLTLPFWHSGSRCRLLLAVCDITLFIADSEGCYNRHALLACLLGQAVNAELLLWGAHNLSLKFSSERIMLPGTFPCDPAVESAGFPVRLVTRCLVPGRQPPSWGYHLWALSAVPPALSMSAGPISTKGFTELWSMYCTAQAATLLMKRWTNSLSTWL